MLVQRISSSAELSQLADQWNSLARGVPFRSWQWLFSWWRSYGDEGELFVLAVRDSAGRLVGAAPLYLSHTAARGRVVRFSGSGEVCSEHLTVLSAPEHEDAVVAAAAQWLIEASAHTRGPDRWDLLELTGVDAHDLAMRKLGERLEQEGCPVHRRAGMPCWIAELPASWEEYLATFSKPFRKHVRQFERRVLDAGQGVFRTVRQRDELEGGMNTLVDLHQRRWRSLGQPGCFASQRFSRFLHEAAEGLLDAGQLRLHRLELDGRPAAAAFHFASGGVAYAYQGGAHPGLLDQSPGILIHIAAIREAVRDGQRAFDFLRGDERWKGHWRAQPQPTVELRVAARRVGARVRHGAWRAGNAMKRWVKSGLQTVRVPKQTQQGEQIAAGSPA